MAHLGHALKEVTLGELLDQGLAGDASVGQLLHLEPLGWVPERDHVKVRTLQRRKVAPAVAASAEGPKRHTDDGLKCVARERYQVRARMVATRRESS
jgi:hypothetical protein